ncbi:MAG: serine hydrolase domain-containing protein [Candidatus Krumholzibacteriia bacterium]
MRRFLALVLWIAVAAGAASEETEPPASLEELEQALRDTLQTHETPGLALALVSRDAVLWTAGIGWADVAAGKQMDATTLLRVGSISKTFVSIAVLMLREEGLLNLEDRVRDLAPEIEFTNRWEETDPVRLVHLLEHTTGFDDIHLREYAHNDPNPISLHDALAYNPSSRTSRWKPGTHFSYCNSGPPIAAYVIEKITGLSFEEFVRSRIFEPLEMSTASYFLDDDVERRLARGYASDGATEQPYWHISLRPSGSINASAPELAHVVQLLLNRGTFRGRTLLAPESVERMETSTSTLAAKAGLRVGYGLGNYATVDGGFVWCGHAGGTNGYLADYEYIPEHGVGFVFMINAVQGGAFRAVRGLLRSYLTRDLDAPPLPVPDVSVAEFEAYSGYYEPMTPRVELSRFLIRILGITRVVLAEDRVLFEPLFGEVRTGDTDAAPQ